MPEGAVSTPSGMQKCMMVSLKSSLQPSSVGTDALGHEGAVGQGNQFKRCSVMLKIKTTREIGFWLGKPQDCLG